MAKLPIPKPMVGVKFNKLFYIETNNIEPDMILPALFWLVCSQGKDRSGRGSKIAMQDKIDRLLTSGKVRGFGDEASSRLLDRWIRSSLVQTGKIGRSHKDGEQIIFIRPLSFLAYKPGLPTESSRLRLAHKFIYHVCHDYMESQKGVTSGVNRFEACLKEAFAKGVVLDEGHIKDGRYDEKTDLDVETLLQMRYMQVFEPPRESKEREKPPAPACAWAASLLARDFTSFVSAYGSRMPTTVLARQILCLTMFELLIYTLRLTKATNTLVHENAAPPEFDCVRREFTPLDLYVDLTQKQGSRSDLIARECVSRDTEAFEAYFRASLTLRTIDRYAYRNRRVQLTEEEGGPYIMALHSLRDDPNVLAKAGLELDQIRDELTKDDKQIPQDVQFVLDSDLDDLATVVEILVLAQRGNGVSSLLKWYGDVGGLNRPDGLLVGNTKGKRVWRYVMSDMLLETLVQLAVISPDARHNSSNGIGTGTVRPDSITLSAFLKFLRDRFGLLIDAPPAFDESVEATAAAKDNFAALKTRLRQMGLFLDLSDDFNAQRIFPRFCEPENDSPVS